MIIGTGHILKVVCQTYNKNTTTECSALMVKKNCVALVCLLQDNGTFFCKLDSRFLLTLVAVGIVVPLSYVSNAKFKKIMIFLRLQYMSLKLKGHKGLSFYYT